MPPRDCTETPVFLSSMRSLRNQFKVNKKDKKPFHNLCQGKTQKHLLTSAKQNQKYMTGLSTNVLSVVSSSRLCLKSFDFYLIL